MFNRSKKYVVLLLINIIALFGFYLTQQDNTDSDPFDNDFVFGLIEKEDKLVKSVNKLNAQLNEYSQAAQDAEVQLKQTRLLVTTSERKYLSCESEKQDILSAQRQVQTGLNCTNNDAELNAATAKITSLNKQLKKLQVEYTQTQEALINAQQLVTQAQNRDNKKFDELNTEIKALKQAIAEPIFVSKHFLSARYCDKPKYEELICVVEFLIRPSFSKPPITRLGIKLLDKEGTTVITQEFDASQSGLYRISMGRGKELPAGKYTVLYSIDNQTIRSPDVILSQD